MAMPPQLAAAMGNKKKGKKVSPAVQAAAVKRVADFAEGLNPNPPGQSKFAPKKKG